MDGKKMMNNRNNRDYASGSAAAAAPLVPAAPVPPQLPQPPQQQQRRPAITRSRSPHRSMQQHNRPSASNAAAGSSGDQAPPYVRRIATISENEPNSQYATYLLKFIQNRMSNKYLANFQYPFIHTYDNYNKVMKIGQGTFGEVFKARCIKTQRFVALKKILMENEREGFPITAIREVKMLQRLKNMYITELIEICNTKTVSPHDKSFFYLVFTFCDFDLAGLLSHKGVEFQLADIKCMMKHLLEGLHRIHHANILHRDMKTANILVSPDGVLRLADFGLARHMIKTGKPINYTNRVVTLWYRPPELLLGSRRYGPAIDMWGVGCIMAELWTRYPILQGDTEQRQLDLIQDLCGGISQAVWPDVNHLPYFNRVQLHPDRPRILVSKMKQKTQDMGALRLLDALLTLDPAKRINASTALDDNWFYEDEYPPNIKHIVKNLPKNMFEFTAGRGAHAGRQPQQQQPQRNNPAAHGPPAGADQRRARAVASNRPTLKNPQDGQFHEPIY